MLAEIKLPETHPLLSKPSKPSCPESRRLALSASCLDVFIESGLTISSFSLSIGSSPRAPPPSPQCEGGAQALAAGETALETAGSSDVPLELEI